MVSKQTKQATRARRALYLFSNTTNTQQLNYSIEADTLSFVLIYFSRVLPQPEIFYKSHLITSSYFFKTIQCVLQYTDFAGKVIQT